MLPGKFKLKNLYFFQFRQFRRNLDAVILGVVYSDLKYYVKVYMYIHRALTISQK